MNKKIAIIPAITVIAIIAAFSQMSSETTEDKTVEIETVEIKTIEEDENTILMPVKAARPAPQDVTPEKIKEKVDDDEHIDTKKKKALEIKKVKEGVGAF